MSKFGFFKSFQITNKIFVEKITDANSCYNFILYIKIEYDDNTYDNKNFECF